jgi:membrane associated rhomboid family serine protease
MALGTPRQQAAGHAAVSPIGSPVRATPALALLCTTLWVLNRAFPSDAWLPFLLRPWTFSPISMFTAPFIHLEPVHLASNLVLLALFGPPLERRLGSGLFLLLYVGAGLLAALLHLSISLAFQVGQKQYASGASGAIAGLMGAYTVLNVGSQAGPNEEMSSPLGLARARRSDSPGPAVRRTWRWPTARTVLLTLVVLWIFAEILQGSIKLLNGGQDVAHWAHIGGFLFGLIIMVAMGQGTGGQEQFLTEGRALLRRGLYPEAERVLERAWSLQPHDPLTVLSLARAKQAVGAGETARELLAAALEQEVRNAQAERAVPLYLEARKLAPRLRLSREAFYRIGGWLGEQGAWGEACAALERAAEVDRRETASRDGRDASQSGQSEARLPRPADPLAATALFRAAEVALSRLQQPERAVMLLERLLREQPQSQWQALAERQLRQLRPAPASDDEEPRG